MEEARHAYIHTIKMLSNVNSKYLNGLPGDDTTGEGSLYYPCPYPRPDKVYLVMTLLVKDLYAIYTWRRKNLK